ncbi:MAG: CopG family transcriptional regulator [Alphaproteobacteria bacterium]|nr:CopG family transcriptional regulator [Alphaproteobacteria bacterium]MBU0833920.1 CopG family transcriptional regulator [Alphaproteobacteria bacterium]MBU1766162.1 CopG family transcriptional regulator [Alphaproteobacteria bacterium]
MKTISAEELDKKFDDGEDVSEYFDWVNAWRPNELIETSLHLSALQLRQLDEEAARLGVTREALVAGWIGEKLKGARWPK